MNGNPRTCEEVRVELGVYVLGALDSAERLSVDEHLAQCSACRSEVSGLAELPPLLGRLSEAEVTDGLSVAPPPSMLDGLLREVTAERRRVRRRGLLAVAAVGLVAVLGAGVGVAAVTSGGQPEQVIRTAAATPEGISANAGLRPVGDGTAITLEISGVRAGEHCRLVAVTDAGRQQVVSEWQVDYSGVAGVHASAAGPPEDLEALRVETDSGTRLVDLPVPSRA
jgi:Putative zinc-finger